MHYRSNRTVLLGPAANVDSSLYDDRDVDLFRKDPTFNTDLAQAITQVDDPALAAEIARFRNPNAQLPTVTSRAFFLDKACQALMDLQKERQELDREFLQQLEGSRRRPINGRAKSRVSERWTRSIWQET